MVFDQLFVNLIICRMFVVCNGVEYLVVCLVEMKCLNVIWGIVSGGLGDCLGVVVVWQQCDLVCIFVGVGVCGLYDMLLLLLDELCWLYVVGYLQVIGEFIVQYVGLMLSDLFYDVLLVLVEELDVLVVLYIGFMFEGMIFDFCC